MDQTPYEVPNHLLAGANAAQARQLGTTLRVGRVLRGQVLEAFGDQAYLIRVGKHRFSLQADLLLSVGQSFFFRVEKGRAKDELTLRILSDPGLTEFRLHDALRMVLRQERPLGELLVELSESLPELAEGFSEAERALADELGQRLAEHVLEAGADGLELGELLARIGLGYEASLLRLGTESDPLSAGLADLVGVDHDLKAELLALLRTAGEGPLAVELGAALAALEAEQVLQVARQVEGDPNHWTFPVRDGERLTMASLFVQHREVTEFDPLSTPRWRVTLAVNFQATGPVRADFTMGAGGVTMRVLVTDKELVVPMQARTKALQDVLADIVDVGVAKEFLPARVSVLAASSEDVDVSRRHLDIAFLRRRKVLDLRG